MRNKGFKGLFFGIIFLFFLSCFSFSFVSTGSLKVTNEHPFLVNGSWVSASDLKVGDMLKTDDGRKVRITSIEDVVEKNPFLVYNLEAGVFHNFIVDSGDGVGVVAHNSDYVKLPVEVSQLCPDCIRGSTKVRISFPDGREEIMPFGEVYAYQIRNPASKVALLGKNGERLMIEGITQNQYSGEIISFDVLGAGGNYITTRVTSNHLVQLADGRFVEARVLKPGSIVRSSSGGIVVKAVRINQVENANVYTILTSGGEPYALQQGSPILKTPGGIASIDIALTKCSVNTPMIRSVKELQSVKFSKTIYVRFERYQDIEWPLRGEVGNLPFNPQMVNPQRGPRISCFTLTQLQKDGFFDMNPADKSSYLAKFGIRVNNPTNRDVIYFQIEESAHIETYQGYKGTYTNIIVDGKNVPAVKRLRPGEAK